MPIGDPSTFGIEFNNFVLYDYDENQDIPVPPSSPISAAVILWQNVHILSEYAFTLNSFRVYCQPESACNITLRGFSTDTNGNRQQSGSGWFTVPDATSFVLATMDAGSLGGLVGNFQEIDQVQITGEFGGLPEVVWIDDFIFSRNDGSCTT